MAILKVARLGHPVLLRGVAFGNDVWQNVRLPRRHRSNGPQHLPPSEVSIFSRPPICWLRSCRNSAKT